MLEISPAQAYCAIGFAVIAGIFPERVNFVFYCGGVLSFVLTLFFVQLY